MKLEYFLFLGVGISFFLLFLAAPRHFFEEVDLSPMGRFVCEERSGWFFQNRTRVCAGWGDNK